MKKILITGADSYIGTSFEKRVLKWPDEYAVDTLDMIGDSWKEKSFAGYDAVFHVAGIAHEKETKQNEELYYKVNRDLAIGTAQKAKIDGVKQFVFLSSMSVYGLETGVITKETIPNPKTNYGKSKLQAEERIIPFAGTDFAVTIIRPPMVYGDGCKGNYQTLVKLAQKLIVCPKYINKRSMIHIDNLSMFVKAIIDAQAGGTYYPQNRNYVCTCDMIKKIASDKGRRIRMTRILNPAVHILKACTTVGRKAFGDLIYKNMETMDYSYCVTE
jgi:UDP-glucose 4-epimerase